jgi:hypothetical protein
VPQPREQALVALPAHRLELQRGRVAGVVADRGQRALRDRQAQLERVGTGDDLRLRPAGQ